MQPEQTTPYQRGPQVAKTFAEMIPTIEAIAAEQRAATSSRARARHLNELYSYMSDHMLLLYLEPKQLSDFARKARELYATIPTKRKAEEYDTLRETLDMFLILARE